MKSKIGRPKKERPEVEIEGFRLLPYIKILENDKFECQICKELFKTRHNLFKHINRHHWQEIEFKPFLSKKSDEEKKYDCEKKICKKLYGYKNRQLWCEVCTKISKTKKPYIVC